MKIVRAARQEFLERAAVKAARQEAARHGGVPPPLDAFRRLRIQVMEPLLRIALLGVGLVTGAMAYWLHRNVGNLPLTIFIGGVAATFVVIAAVGRKETVENALAEAADFVFQRFLDCR
jgi:hypothetical protein